MRHLVRIAALAAAAVALLALPASAQEEARIHLIHGIPGVPVDVLVDGSPVIEGFQPGDIEDLSSFAGQTLTNLQVTAEGDPGTVLIDAGDTDLPASGNFSIIAHWEEGKTPALAVFPNDTSETAAGEGRLTVRHTADAPAVDVLAGGSPVIEGLENPNEQILDLPVGTVSAAVAVAGSTDPVIGPADITIEEGTNLIVYAVGSASGDPAGLELLTETITVGAAAAETPAETPAAEQPASQTPVPSAVNTGNSPVSEDGTGFPVAVVALAALLVVAIPARRVVLARTR
jgi:hypothetical protein